MLRVELGPKEATEGTCILARCRKAGAVSALCVKLWDLCFLWGRVQRTVHDGATRGASKLRWQRPCLEQLSPGCRLGLDTNRSSSAFIDAFSAASTTAGEVAQKQTLAIGPALCDRVKQHLEEMGETLAPPEAAAAAAGAGDQQQGAAEGEEQGQQEPEEQQAGQKAKKGAAAAAPAGAAQQAQQEEQQPAQVQRQQGKLQSAEDLEGDFAGVPLLGVS